MIETVLPSLRDLIKDFIISTLEKGVNSIIYDQIDKIYLRVRKDADENITKSDFKEAAKVYLLASKALKEGARGGDKEVSGTIIDTALAWQKQAEQTLYDETRSYINKAYEYEKQNDYEGAIALKNKAKTLEYEINTGSLNKKLNEEVSAIYNSIRNDAYAEHGRIRAQNALKSFSSAIGRIFGHKSEESLPELKEESPAEDTSEMHITPEQIIIKNDYKPSEISDRYYDWSVYLIANKNVMNQIESVIYTLHPTFALPVQTVKIPYLFSWDAIPGIDDGRLIEFLVKDYNFKWEEKAYLFSWHDIPGRDDVRLKHYLTKKLGIKWVENAKIEKIDGDKTIRLFFENNFLSLMLNEEKTKVRLITDDGRNDELIAAAENNMVKIYKAAKIEKIDGDRTIRLSFENNFLSLMLNDEKTKVKLITDDGRTDELIADMENGKVNIYKIPNSGFRLKTTGWGEFQLKADINLKNGETITKYHWLDLGFRSKGKVGEK